MFIVLAIVMWVLLGALVVALCACARIGDHGVMGVGAAEHGDRRGAAGLGLAAAGASVCARIEEHGEDVLERDTLAA